MEDMRIWVSIITPILGTIITIITFYRASKKDFNLEYERRLNDATVRATQHTEMTMKLDTILNSHNRLEKDVVELDVRMGHVENRLTKNESEHESARQRFQRLESHINE